MANFGATLLDKYGRGKLNQKQKDDLSADLQKQLYANAAGVEISGEVLEKEITRFLEFGYASENNLDRLQRRVLRIPKENGRAEDATSMKSLGSMAYSQPTRVGKSGTDTPSGRKNYSITDGMKSQTDGFQAGSLSARRPPESEPPMSPSSVRSPASARSDRGASNNGCKWSTVAKLNAKRELQEAENKKAAIKEKQLQLKGYLDEQVASKTSSKTQKAEETLRLRNMVDTDYNRLQEEEANKQKRMQNQVKILKDDREEQVLHARLARDIERSERLEAGKTLAVQANRDLEKEQQAALNKKHAERQLMSKLIVEWAEERVVGDEKKKVEQAAEKQEVLRLQEELRKEEQKKQDIMRKEIAARDAQFQELAAEEANAKMAKKMKREARIKAENASMVIVNQAEAEAVERDRQKLLAKKAERIQNVEFLFQQMGEKKEQKKTEKEAKSAMLDGARTAIDTYAEDERKRSLDKRNKNVQHRLELEEQINARIRLPATMREDLMSTSEAFINKNLVGEAGKLGLY